jgi:hypothetical protein
MMQIKGVLFKIVGTEWGQNRVLRKTKKAYKLLIKCKPLILLVLGRELNPHSLKDRGILRPIQMKDGWNNNHPFFFLNVCYA